MARPGEPADRYEPLPGLLGLPALFLSKLSPRGRTMVVVAAVVLLAAGVAATIVLAPRIAESNRERAAAQRRAQARSAAEERARLIAEQRPRLGRLEPRGGAALSGAIERAITRDARARVATGELQTPARRTECRTLTREGARLILGCTAITSQVGRSQSTEGLIVGYPYRAAVSTRTGRYGICKTSGRPGEGFLTRGGDVPLPHACGG
jgi:type II secretory pathway pseudopilin PulG